MTCQRSGVRLGAGVTLSLGLAAAHQSIVGNRLRLALDSDLCAAVTGMPGPLAHPGLVCDVAIGQSTLATQRVKANLFYRGLRFHRFPAVGDTLYTRTEVVGLRANSPKPSRAPTGLAGLRMTTIDRTDRLVLDFYRCAMLPASPDWKPGAVPGDDLSGSVPTRRRRPPIQPHTGTVRFSESGFPGRTSMPVLPVRCCIAPQTWSVERRSWLGSPSISLLRTMIGGSADDGWSTAGIPSDWHSRRQPGYCLTWRPSWTGNPATTPLRYTRATPSTASCISSLRRPTQTGVCWDCGHWSTRSAIRRVSPIGRCSTGVLAPCNSRFGY